MCFQGGARVYVCLRMGAHVVSLHVHVSVCCALIRMSMCRPFLLEENN